MLLHGPASTVIHSSKSHDPHKKSKSASTICPGYALVFPEGQNHFGSYPFGLHATRTLPWSFIITNDAMRLHSDSCTHSPQYHKDSTVPLPCSWCRILYNHTIIMGICHWALDGTHENTPWQYLSFVELGQALQRKNHHLKQLNFNGLNMGHALMGTSSLPSQSVLVTLHGYTASFEQSYEMVQVFLGFLIKLAKLQSLPIAQKDMRKQITTAHFCSGN